MDHAFTRSPLVHGSVAELQADSLDNHRLGLIQDKSMHGPVAELQRLLGYSLNDPRLLVEALTHPSHPSRPTYERLEHLGDAALNLAFTNYLYRKNPTLEPGPLTVLRSANVCTEKLARVAVRHSLYRYLRRNTPVQDQMAEEFAQSVIQEDTAATAAAAFGGTTVKARKVLADIVESIAGAVYIDTGYDLRILWKVMKPLLQPIITSETFDVHAVTKVTQLCQKLKKHIVFVDSITGEGDSKVNVVWAVVDGEMFAEGYSDQRSIAKLNASREALLRLQTTNTVHDAPVTVESPASRETFLRSQTANTEHEDPAAREALLRLQTTNTVHDAPVTVESPASRETLLRLQTANTEHEDPAAREALLRLQTANTHTVHGDPVIVESPEGLDVSDGQEAIRRSVVQLTMKQVTHEVCRVEEGEAIVGAKQELHILCQKKHWKFPIYKVDREEGPAHDKRFVASVLVQTPDADFVMLSGLKQKLKEAENQAAFGLLLKLLNI